jgi:hypothetical protein
MFAALSIAPAGQRPHRATGADRTHERRSSRTIARALIVTVHRWFCGARGAVEVLSIEHPVRSPFAHHSACWSKKG